MKEGLIPLSLSPFLLLSSFPLLFSSLQFSSLLFLSSTISHQEHSTSDHSSIVVCGKTGCSVPMFISEIAVHIRVATSARVEFLKDKDMNVIQVCSGCEKTLNSAGQAAKIG